MHALTSFPETLARHLLRSQIVERDLAAAIDVSQSLITKWKQDVSAPKTAQIQGMMEVFKIPPDGRDAFYASAISAHLQADMRPWLFEQIHRLKCAEQTVAAQAEQIASIEASLVALEGRLQALQRGA